MRACWEALRASFLRSVTTLNADMSFRAVRSATAVLSRFESPVGLIEYLTTRTDKPAELDSKDAIYAALVRAVQTREPWAEFANAIVWCGLWPGLDGIYRRRLRYFKHDPDELVEAISVALSTLLGRVDLVRVKRVAATLVRSTERDLMDERRREWAMQEHHAGESEEDEKRVEARTRPPRESELGLPVGLSFDGELEALRAWLLPISGADTDLVLGVLVLDENQHEAAERLGLTHEAARKRIQRVLKRIRPRLAEVLSQFDEPPRVCGDGRAKKAGGPLR